MSPRSTLCAAATRTASLRAGWPATAAPTTSCAAAPSSLSVWRQWETEDCRTDRIGELSRCWRAVATSKSCRIRRTRILRPMVRRGWLEQGAAPDERRGRDEFVAVSWSRALNLVAAELRRCYAEYGARAIFGGSYGWGSAGRFHDAQSQIHRFLNLAGGYVRSVNSYSSGAATVILPHILGPQGAVAGNTISWAELVSKSELVLAFGGMALKNNDGGAGGTSRNIARAQLREARTGGIEFHLIGPIRDDLPAEIEAIWHPIRPGTDVALMLGLAHTLVTEGRHDRAFLDGFCVGWEVFEDYLLGRHDGQPKDAAWAAALCGTPPAEITAPP